MRRLAAAALVLGAALAGAPPPAAAQTAGSAPERSARGLRPVSPAFAVQGRQRTPAEVIATARAVPKVARVLRAHPGTQAEPYVRGSDEWQVAFRDDGEEIAQVHLDDDASGRVTEAWTGIQVAWPMARGYPGAFGRDAASLPVWLACLVLFLAPFLRPPWGWLHVDLAALASFSISLAFFGDGVIGASVPLAYPPLAYLLVRLLVLACRPAPRRPLALVGARVLGVAVVFLLGFRLALQVFDSNAIDVGYAGVIGADKLAHGRDLYTSFPADNPHGDTYGPLNYLAYVPFELVFPWHGTWDDLPAAHAAAATFDLACVAGLYLVGRRRSPTHGLLLAYLWLAFPFTLLTANSGANDALVGALVLAAVALGGRPGLRGAAAAAGALVKLAPLALLPLLARTRRAALGAAAVAAGALALVLLLDGGLGDMWRRTVLFQLDRDSPFSVWGLYDLRGAQLVVEIAAGLLALAVARAPARMDRYALAAAVLVAVQLGAGHWFYLYLVWFLPVAFVALLSGYDIGRSTGSIESASPAREQRISTALSHGSPVAGS